VGDISLEKEVNSKSAKEKPSIDTATIDKIAAAQKILSSVSYEKGFYFFIDIGKKTGEPAFNMSGLYEELRVIEPQSVRFHFQRKDFQNWVKDVLGDAELAQRIDMIKADLTDQDLRSELLKTVLTRFTELQTISFNASKQKSSEPSANNSAAELKKFNLEELKQFNGQSGKPAYFVFEGKVYDVTNSSSWQGGNHEGAHQAGKDLTEALKIAPHGKEAFSKVKQIGILVQ
jgi:predicted heme/steroid binding protein